MKTNIIFAIQLLIFTYTVTNCSAKPGGWTDMGGNSRDAIQVANVALSNYKGGGGLDFITVIGGQYQMVRGINYRIAFLARTLNRIRFPDFFCYTLAYKNLRGEITVKFMDCKNILPQPNDY